MNKVVDFFFSPYPTAQVRRLHAAIKYGLAHGSRIDPLDPAPGEPVTMLFSTNARLPIEHLAVYYTTDGSMPEGERGIPTNGKVVLAEPGEREEQTHNDELFLVQQWRATLPAQEAGTPVRYRADAWSLSNPAQHWYADSVDPVSEVPADGRIFMYHVDHWTTPQWWHDTVAYQIFVDRFHAAQDEPPLPGYDEQPDITAFLGGTLAGILEKLDYIQALGINCIWLSPIFDSPIYHGYNPSDYFQVARRYGGNEKLRTLIQEAHRRGMRVMLDFVANHTSDLHPAFIAARNDSQSPSSTWYAFGDQYPHGYRTYTTIKEMPELLTDHQDVQNHLFAALEYWVGEFGVDALRLDYASGPSFAFWALFQKHMKERFPQTLTIGEVTGPLTEINNYAGRIDAFMDFPLTKYLRTVFALRQVPLSALFAYIDERISSLPPTMSRATLLDNHDMHRFLWLADDQPQRLRLAATCHLTLEGTPIIYYGTEVGLSQPDDAHVENGYARAPMLWDGQQDLSLLEHYQKLIALRHQEPALRYGNMQTLAIHTPNATEEQQQQVGAYIRHLDGESVLIILNNNEQPIQVSIDLKDLSASPQLLYTSAPQQKISIQDDQLRLELAALGAVILKSHH